MWFYHSWQMCVCVCVCVHRAHILQLLHPAGTVMDLNIGAALWLAVRADGRLYTPAAATATAAPAPAAVASSRPITATATAAASSGPATCAAATGQPYRSAARVVFMGHGADEQCAGYGRHRTRYACVGVSLCV